jgi:hypothetical protein
LDRNQLDEIISLCLQELYDQDGQILAQDIGERAICGRLAMLMGPKFPMYSVDIEYNRKGPGLEPKDIEMPDENGELTTNRVFRISLCMSVGGPVAYSVEIATPPRPLHRSRLQGPRQHHLLPLPAVHVCLIESGASSVRRRTRVMYDGAIPSRFPSLAMMAISPGSSIRFYRKARASASRTGARSSASGRRVPADRMPVPARAAIGDK